MKSLIVVIFLSVSIYCQNNSINCDSLNYPENGYCIYVEKTPELIGGLDILQLRLSYPQ